MDSNIDRVENFFKYMASDEVLENGRLSPTAFTRNTKMGFFDILMFMLTKGENNTSMELNNYCETIGINSISRQAYSLSRKQINPLIIKHLGEWYIKQIYESREFKTYKSYILLAIDGCLLDLPWIDELKEEYGGKVDKNGEVEAIKARSSGLYDVLNNLMVNLEIEPFKVSEKVLGFQNIENLQKILPDEKILIIFDRYYASFEFFNYLLDSNINFIFRLKKSAYQYEIEKMTTNDENIEIKITDGRINHIKDQNLKNKLKNRDKFNLRVTKIILDSGEEELLISNLTYEEFSYNEIKELYNKRWKIETSYDKLKNSFKIEKITGKSKLTVEQDFYSQILAYNMVEDLAKHANNELKKTKKIN
jgi:hypothetical protein